MKKRIGYIHGYDSSSEKSTTLENIRSITGADVIGIDYDTPTTEDHSDKFKLIYDDVIAQIIGNRPLDLIIASSFGAHVLNAIGSPFIIDDIPKLLINPAVNPSVSLAKFGHSDEQLKTGLQQTGPTRPNTTVAVASQDELIDPTWAEDWATKASKYKGQTRFKSIDGGHSLTYDQLESLFKNDNFLQKFLPE